jgi:predicted nuclease of predicted toxin-antitoxin system
VNGVSSARPDLKLLFDQNLPSRFTSSLADLFPGSEHLKLIGLAAADDQTVWDYARQNGFAIISKDSDFHQMSFL